MFNFDGEFRRRPQQNLGGASQKTDRLTVIRKAQQERQKREEARRQQNGAIVIQSAVRSFIQRQQTKRRERGKFDEYRKTNGIRNGHDLEYLTKRILFFYQQQTGQDGDRLIFLCQYMIKNPGETFKHVASEVIWTYRIKRLLGLCLGQILIPEHSPTIPMRMLEIYSSNTYISKHLPPGATPNQQHQAIQQYLTTVYGHLIEHRYFHVVRQLIEEKVPSIDTDTTTMPHPIADALFDMLLRPLKLVQPDPQDVLSRQILQSFTFNARSPSVGRTKCFT